MPPPMFSRVSHSFGSLPRSRNFRGVVLPYDSPKNDCVGGYSFGGCSSPSAIEGGKGGGGVFWRDLPFNSVMRTFLTLLSS